MDVNSLLKHFQDVRTFGNKRNVQCPINPSRRLDLIFEGDSLVGKECPAGCKLKCSAKQILDAVGFNVEDISDSPKLIRLSQVSYEPPEWLMEPYLQKGKSTLIQANSGVGKTAFVCGLIACVTSGKSLLGHSVDKPGNVLLLSGEDDAPILRGRIEADGGDVSRVFIPEDMSRYSLSSPEVENSVRECGAVMVVFDPIQSYLGANVDMFRANETRPILDSLNAMLKRNHCTGVIIGHLAKNSAGRAAVNQTLGSADIPAAMRSILHITANPDNDEERVAVHVKSSNAKRGESIVYTIGDRGRVDWLRHSSMTPNDLEELPKRKSQPKALPYDREPLVKVFRALAVPGGKFYSYKDFAIECRNVLGYVPYDNENPKELGRKLNSGLSAELFRLDNIGVEMGARFGANRQRGICVSLYAQPTIEQQEMPLELPRRTEAL